MFLPFYNHNNHLEIILSKDVFDEIFMIFNDKMIKVVLNILPFQQICLLINLHN